MPVDNTTITQSNVFGAPGAGITGIAPEADSKETTAAGKLIEHLKYISDSHLTRMVDRANWLGLAANAGQNNDPRSLIKGELLKPDKLLRASALASWEIPAISAGKLDLPSIPDNLKLDVAKITSQFTEDISKLRDNWMAKYLPEQKEIDGSSPLGDLIKHSLNGDYYKDAKADLKTLADSVKTALKATSDKLRDLFSRDKADSLTSKHLANVTSNLATAKAATATNLATAKTNLVANLKALKDALTDPTTGNLAKAKANLDDNLKALKGSIYTTGSGNLAVAKKSIDDNVKALQEAIDNSSTGYLAVTKKSLTDSLAALKNAIDNSSTGNLAIAKKNLDANMAKLAAAIAQALADAKTRVAANYADLKAALLANEATLQAHVAGQLATTKTDTAANISTAKAEAATNVTSAKLGVTDAVTTAKDNVQNIAFGRMRDQAAREGARLENEAVSAFAARGFTLPTGALAAQLAKARQATQNAVSDAAAVQAEKSQQFFFDVARMQVDVYLRALDSQLSASIKLAELQNGVAVRALELLEGADLRVLELRQDAGVKVMDLLNAADLKYLDLQDAANLRLLELAAQADLRSLELKDEADLKAMELRDAADTRVLDVKARTQVAALEARNQTDTRVLDLTNTADLKVLEIKDSDDMRVAQLRNDADAKVIDLTNQVDLGVLERNNTADLRVLELQDAGELASYRLVGDMNLEFAKLENESERDAAKRAFDHLGLTLDFTKFSADLAVKYRLGVQEAISNLVRAYSGLRTNELEYVNAIERTQRDAQQAVLDYYRTAIQAAEVGMRLDVQNNENDLRWAQIAASFIGVAVGHHVQAATAAADAFARTAGMALSGLNGVASITSAA